MKFNDLTGQRFGRLVALRTDGKDSQGKYKWLCRCDCGNEKSVPGTYLTQGYTRSCGCMRSEAVTEHNRSADKRASTAKWNSIYKKKHGKHGTRLYRVWSGMKQRCQNTRSEAYQYYGGRGISVFPEWNEDFDAFYSWAMANGYDENAMHGECTIDRIDINGNYEPGNCRWVSIAEQNRNKRPGGRRCAKSSRKCQG